jgi:hypothetical protein
MSTWAKKAKPDITPGDQTPEEIREKEKVAREAYLLAQLPYRWITEVEVNCRRAFVPDADIMARCRARVAVRGCPRGPEIIDRMSAYLDRQLTAAEQSEVDARYARAIANRDLLAHRTGRESATRRWQSEPSDCYGQGVGAYRRRLAEIGKVMAELGWLQEPDEHPWKKQRPRLGLSDSDLAERERKAVELAARSVG